MPRGTRTSSRHSGRSIMQREAEQRRCLILAGVSRPCRNCKIDAEVHLIQINIQTEHCFCRSCCPSCSRPRSTANKVGASASGGSK